MIINFTTTSRAKSRVPGTGRKVATQAFINLLHQGGNQTGDRQPRLIPRAQGGFGRRRDLLSRKAINNAARRWSIDGIQTQLRCVRSCLLVRKCLPAKCVSPFTNPGEAKAYATALPGSGTAKSSTSWGGEVRATALYLPFSFRLCKERSNGYKITAQCSRFGGRFSFLRALN